MNLGILIVLIKTYYETFLIALVIFFGSVVHATNAIKKKRKIKESISIIDIIILMVISGFSGFLFALGPLAFGLNIYFTMMFAGIGAYLGVEGLNVISRASLEGLVNYLNTKKGIDIKIDKYEK